MKSLGSRANSRREGKNKSSLCGAESQLEVFSGLAGVEGWILERVGEEAVHQGAEGYAIFPAGGEVVDAHPLVQSRSMWNTRSRELRRKSLQKQEFLCRHCDVCARIRALGSSQRGSYPATPGFSSRVTFLAVGRADSDALSPQPSPLLTGGKL